MKQRYHLHLTQKKIDNALKIQEDTGNYHVCQDCIVAKLIAEKIGDIFEIGISDISYNREYIFTSAKLGLEFNLNKRLCELAKKFDDRKPITPGRYSITLDNLL